MAQVFPYDPKPKFDAISIAHLQVSMHRELMERLQSTRRYLKPLTIRADNGLRIQVVFVASGERRRIYIPLRATAGDLRGALGLNTESDSCQRLYFNGLHLSNDSVLEDYGVVSQSTLTLVADPIIDDTSTTHVATVSADQDTATLVPLSQLSLDKNSLHIASRFRRCVINYFDACLYPRVPESSQSWWWPRFNSFREIREGRRVQVLAGGERWVDGQVVSVTSKTTDFDISSEDNQWAGESTWYCTVRLLSGEQSGRETIVDSLSRIRGMPVPG